MFVFYVGRVELTWENKLSDLLWSPMVSYGLQCCPMLTNSLQWSAMFSNGLVSSVLVWSKVCDSTSSESEALPIQLN